MRVWKEATKRTLGCVAALTLCRCEQLAEDGPASMNSWDKGTFFFFLSFHLSMGQSVEFNSEMKSLLCRQR